MRTRSRNRKPLGDPKFMVEVKGKEPFIAAYNVATLRYREWVKEYGAENVTWSAHKEQG